jgi:hypothetical protein
MKQFGIHRIQGHLEWLEVAPNYEFEARGAITAQSIKVNESTRPRVAVAAGVNLFDGLPGRYANRDT